MTDLETMAATVQGQHDALMVAQGLPTYDRLKRERDAIEESVRQWLNRNLDNVAFTAQVDLLRILGVKIL